MTVKLGVVMDPIADINYKKDTTMAMLWAAQARDWELFYMEQGDLYLETGVARARMAPLTVFHDPISWFELDDSADGELAELDVILMRKDPPFRQRVHLQYIYSGSGRAQGHSDCQPLPKPAGLQRESLCHPISPVLPAGAGQRRYDRLRDFHRSTGMSSSSRWTAWVAAPFSG